MVDLAALVHAGDRVWWSQGAAEPTPLVDALLDAAPAIGPVRAFVGLCWNDRVTRTPPAELAITSYGALGDLRFLPAGAIDVVRVPMSGLPPLFASGGLALDVGLVQVSPPDADGRCSLGLGTDYAWDAAQHTRVLVAEVNAALPRAVDGPTLPIDGFAAVLRTDRPLQPLPARPPRAVDDAIAAFVAALVEDGDTVQIGVGQIPSAVLGGLAGHRDLGVHSGVITDGVVDLVESGVVTGGRKEIDRGLVVTGSAMGTDRLYRRSAAAPFAFRPVTYTHAPAVLGRLRRLVAINSAVEVDLGGRVNAEVRAGRLVGAIGGQADFAAAAAATGARSIIALPSESGGRSTIVAATRTVSTPAADVDVVVTEHGVAHLTGCSPVERAKRLTAVAAPQHREALERAAGDLLRLTA